MLERARQVYLKYLMYRFIDRTRLDLPPVVMDIVGVTVVNMINI